MRFRKFRVCVLRRPVRPTRSSARSNSDGPPLDGRWLRIASAVTRSSSVQSVTNCTNASRSSWWAGMPSTIRGGPPAVSRTVPVWQTAQLSPA